MSDKEKTGIGCSGYFAMCGVVLFVAAVEVRLLKTCFTLPDSWTAVDDTVPAIYRAYHEPVLYYCFTGTLLLAIITHHYLLKRKR